MSDHAATFRGCIIRAYTVRVHVEAGHYRQAATECKALQLDLAHLPDCPPHVGGADPRAIADALVGHGEAGSPFGMILECAELASLLDRIKGDVNMDSNALAQEAREETDRPDHPDYYKGSPVTESQARNGGD